MNPEHAEATQKFVAAAHAISETGLRVRVRMGHHTIVADESVAIGGEDAGPQPYALLLASLATCTSMTLSMYAARKQWTIGEIKVDVAMFRDGESDRIERKLMLAAHLDEQQRTRLLEIAEKTPVTKTLKRGTTIITTLV